MEKRLIKAPSTTAGSSVEVPRGKQAVSAANWALAVYLPQEAFVPGNKAFGELLNNEL